MVATCEEKTDAAAVLLYEGKLATSKHHAFSKPRFAPMKDTTSKHHSFSKAQICYSCLQVFVVVQISQIQ
jgi:hypothetical protein